MKVLITGASGFVGGRVLQRLREAPGLIPLGVGRRASSAADYRAGDYRAIDLSRPFELDFAPDAVIHAAALSSPFASRREYLRHNVEATRHVIAWCRAHGLPKLVYVSSGAVLYKPRDQLGMREDDPVGPPFANTYAETKAAAEALVRDYPGAWTILRPRAVFGPGDTVLFPRLLAAAQRGRLPWIVREGPPVLGDLIGVDTLAEYILRATRSADATGVFHLGHGEPVVMREFIADVFRRLDLPLPTRSLPYRSARRAATLAEWAWTLLPLRGEPPVTRFGVDVFAFSKTYDPTRTRSVLGAPAQRLAEAVDAFVAWQRPRL